MIIDRTKCCTICKTKESLKDCGDSPKTKQTRIQIMYLHSQGMNAEEIVKTMFKIERNPPYVISDNPSYLPRLEAKIKLVQSIIAEGLTNGK